jgi:glycosyltransferase involved in cell wall biosynthesis
MHSGELRDKVTTCIFQTVMLSREPANPQMKEELTVIIPVYNEEESLPAFFQEFDRIITTSPLPLRGLLVNDGSRDTSLIIIKEKCAKSAHYDYISFDRNYGLSAAIKAGFDHCTTSLVGYIDADLQTSPSDFLSYFQYFPAYDMVNGIRSKRQDSIIKKLSSKCANSYRRFMINDGITDTCCPLKIMKTEYAEKMPFFTGMHRFMPALVQLQGGRVKQIPISHYPRRAGTSKYHLLNRLIGPFFDTLAFRWMRSRYIRYRVAERNR